jgi:hypothetical protein
VRGQIVTRDSSLILYTPNKLIKYDCQTGNYVNQMQLVLPGPASATVFPGPAWRFTEDNTFFYCMHENQLKIVDLASVTVFELELTGSGTSPTSSVLTSTLTLLVTEPTQESAKTNLVCYKIELTSPARSNRLWSKVVSVPKLRISTGAGVWAVLSSPDSFLGTTSLFYSVNLSHGALAALRPGKITTGRPHIINKDVCAFIQDEPDRIDAHFVRLSSGDEFLSSRLPLSHRSDQQRITNARGPIFTTQRSLLRTDPWSLLVLHPYNGGQCFVPSKQTEALLYRFFNFEDRHLYAYDISVNTISKKLVF